MNRSIYDDRETVGSIALSAMQCGDNPCAGDLGHELIPSLIDDLNNAISSNPYNGILFYITIHEKKDAQLTNVILRRLITSSKRPYPEPNTAVFKTDPKTQETRFCWSLPHQSSFLNYTLNPYHYVKEQIEDIKAYQSENLEHFGFRRIGRTHEGVPLTVEIPNFEDRKLKNNV